MFLLGGILSVRGKWTLFGRNITRGNIPDEMVARGIISSRTNKIINKVLGYLTILFALYLLVKGIIDPFGKDFLIRF